MTKTETGRMGDKEIRPRGRRLTATLVQPRFEDGFMVLLKAGKESGRDKRHGKETGRQGDCETRGRERSEDRHGAQGEKETNSCCLPATSPASISRSSLSLLLISQSPDLSIRPWFRFMIWFAASENFVAVDHVSFEVQRGEIFGLLGPNGAGKTTTFRMLCGLLPASGGSLRVAGTDLRRARASARQNIGYVAQKFSLYGQLTVSENLEFFASAYNLRGAQKRSAHRLGFAAIRAGRLGRFAKRQSARRFQAALGDGGGPAA